ncbi:mannose-1-phosphate guanylyltransferase/mannose-6-phosphate isomerase [Tabrizicola piscis]|uniref:mannose-1-phosphate guanylyltransferase n=1 Tax=Tabrizicola piscis TaxID=2494374 RepID=A0A3S8UAA7_9RHOB|nr:mannose-1-phosphate guanylyltransferase/mannose-6-phosphate isomerase [Tabrizicola piscis]AZL60508.1 mannose-1-phosphate guanylyltransferase/mannose-6-phosphate isomerase [Tabrizicola piscis]
MAKLYPVLLCGGSGTRLWPLSRRGFPKQFVPFSGANTLFQAAAIRMATFVDAAPPVIVTNAEFRFIVAEQLGEVFIDPAAVLIEPDARNTGPAVLAAVLTLAASDPEALVLVMPTDHAIPDAAAFRDAVARGVPRAQAGKIVTFGIRPDRPETGYGWLELTTDPQDGLPQPLVRFVEKPKADRAAEMLAEGRYLWNSGIFLASAATLLDAFETHAADLMAPVSEAVRAARVDLGFLRLAPDAWAEARSVSIDYAVMEHAKNLEVVPYDAAWSDLGDWNAVWRETAEEDSSTITHGAVTQIDCVGSLLRSDAEGVHLVGIGLTDLVVVAMADAVLVADRSRAQEVKDAVASMKSNAVRQAEVFPRDHRPWGWFETLILADRFQVKRIVVRPGAALSLQSHVHRAEHWVVVSGTAQVTVGDSVQLLTENQSIYVPLGAVHRLANPGKVPVVLIEIQTGSYLGEDDIIRYEDVYARAEGAKG